MENIIGKRNNVMDIEKCLAIITMLLVHLGFKSWCFYEYFHMGVFFIISGYFFNSKYYSSFEYVKKFIKKRIMQLWLPYFIFSNVHVVFQNFFVKIYGVNNVSYLSVKDLIKYIVKNFFFIDSPYYGIAMWFLGTLFFISILFVINSFIIFTVNLSKKDVIIFQFLLSCLFYYLGGLFQSKTFRIGCLNSFDIGRIFSFYCLFYVGYIINTFSLVTNELKNNKKNYVNFILFVISFMSLFLTYKYNSGERIVFYTNRYKNLFQLLICSISGFYMLYTLSVYIAKIPILSSLCEIIGKNTLIIVISNYWLISSVTYILKKINGNFSNIPIQRTLSAAYNVPYYFRFIYLIICISLPVSISVLYKKIKMIIFR